MTNGQKIPFLDLVTLHAELETELVDVLKKVLRTAGFVGGPMVEAFEKEFAHYCTTEHAIGLASGTDAVRFALMAAGVQPGETVVTVPHTFIATTEGISQAGARIQFVDIEERTYNMDARKLREFCEHACHVDKATGKLVHTETGSSVSAVVPVHIYGQTADMDAIQEIADRYNLIVVEDACQAHGAEYFSKRDNSWKKAGSIGRAAAFSFYPGKNLGACGEAGAVTTNDAAIAGKIRMLRDHGQSRKYFHDVEGYNGRLDALQAGFLSVKLRHLADWTTKRQSAARKYDHLFEGSRDVIAPYRPEWARPVYHLYVVRVSDRGGLMSHLESQGIGTGIHYPGPLHLQKAYDDLGLKKGSFPVTEKIAAEIVSLPMFPQLEAESQHRVADEVKRFTSQTSGVSSSAEVLSGRKA